MKVSTTVPISYILDIAIDIAADQTGVDIHPGHFDSVKMTKAGVEFFFNIPEKEEEKKEKEEEKNEHLAKFDISGSIIPFKKVIKWNKDRIDKSDKKVEQEDVSDGR